MTPARVVVLVIAVASMPAAAPAHAQPADETVLYRMAPQSDFEWGCFEPCACPILVRQPLQGTFKLTKTGSDPMFDTYDVTDVQWTLPDATVPKTIVGSGTYRRGGEVAIQEQLVLDLSVDGGEPRRYDSGLVPPGAPFPEFHTTISLHGQYCFDTVFTVVAKPAGAVSSDLDRRGELLTVAPSPFRVSTNVTFSLARAGRIDLGVFDAAGREVYTLAHGEWLASGQYRRAWDGRLPAGGEAPPGLYFVRIASIDGTQSRAVAKVR